MGFKAAPPTNKIRFKTGFVRILRLLWILGGGGGFLGVSDF